MDFQMCVIKFQHPSKSANILDEKYIFKVMRKLVISVYLYNIFNIYTLYTRTLTRL